jgi:hypothetical protein
MKTVKYFLFFSIIIVALSCEDEAIDWEAKDAPSKLVVEGSFTNEHKIHRIELKESADYFSNQQTPRVSNARVTISGNDSVYKFVEVPGNPGVYESERKIAGSPGIDYRLDIKLNEPINGVTDYHASETMLEGISLTSIEALIYENPMYVEESPMDSTILIVYAYGFEPKKVDNYYRVDLYYNGELDTDTIDEVSVYSDDEEFSNDFAHSLAFFQSVDPKDTLKLEISSVTEKYSYFVEGIKNIADQSGNPFDMTGPPANAIGNIQGGDALGYFRVSFVSSSSTIIRDMREEE